MGWGASAAYRPDIDGLRAVAVSCVVAYHVGLPYAPGGFIGVDVFFVISGFVITKLILTELLETGSIDLINFYARRARRLLPAFFVVTTATVLLWVAMFALSSDEVSELARSALAATLYVSNFHFASVEGDYFAAPAETNPLLHTWSLAVEEQFYLVWPALLLAVLVMARTARVSFDKILRPSLVLLVVASFGYCWWASSSADTAPSAFYLPHARAWQLGLGGLLAISLRGEGVLPRPLGLVLSVLGLGAILVATISYQAGMTYPGLAALLPTVGAATVIAGGVAAPVHAVTRFLSLSPFVALGRLSYGWYLWHWPALAAARALDLGQRDMWRDSLIACVALGLAWVSFRYLEDPIRSRRVLATFDGKAVLGAAAAASFAFLSCCLGLLWLAHAQGSGPGDRTARLASGNNYVNPRRVSCNESATEKAGNWSECSFPRDSARTSILLWGDSHAEHLTPLLDAAAAQRGFSSVQRTMAGCDALGGIHGLSLRGEQVTKCSLFNAGVLDDVRQQLPHGLRGVVLAARWVKYQDKEPLSLHRRLRTEGRRQSSKADMLPLVEARLRRLLEEFGALGLRVAVVAPMPEQRHKPKQCLASQPTAACSIPRKEAESYRADVLAALRRAVEGFKDVRLIDPFDALCEDTLCPVQREERILYRDADHLTPTGARSLLGWFAEIQDWLASGRLVRVHDAANQ